MEDEQFEIDQELGRATLECLDPMWEGAELVINLAGGGVSVSLTRVGADGMGVPSDEVYEAVGRLVHLHRSSATDLQRAIYKFERRSDGEWNFRGEYVYPP